MERDFTRARKNDDRGRHLTDQWGIDDRYVDVAGNERAVARSTLRRLRETIGEPGPK